MTHLKATRPWLSRPGTVRIMFIRMFVRPLEVRDDCFDYSWIRS